MRPLILRYREKPTAPDIDFSTIAYDERLNLNVYKHNREPAIKSPAMITTTGTKTWEEESDSDKCMATLMITSTGSFTKMETSDEDPRYNALFENLITMTATRESIEGSDSDH
jgi:hypothetical protein